jgi:nicotinate-nucleotide pyrophosphorylase (carboxylating)
MDPRRFDGVLRRALDEDLGAAGDLTSEAIFGPDDRTAGALVARKAGTVAGVGLAARVFQLLDERCAVAVEVEDGARVAPGTVLVTVEGPTRAVLSAERTALNLLGRMSGIATATAALVDLVAGTGTRIADTRKTTPTLRAFEKHAVRMGGGSNHRFGLFDAVMVKDNHVLAAGGVRPAVERVRARIGHTVTLEVEVDSLDQLDELLEVGADVVLLDNMDPETMREAVSRVAGRMVVEASGGITVDTVRAVAETGVDVISVGWITHSAPSLDVALDLRT